MACDEILNVVEDCNDTFPRETVAEVDIPSDNGERLYVYEVLSDQVMSAVRFLAHPPGCIAVIRIEHSTARW